jgi:ATP-dependent Clp protease protease subunit
MIKYYQLAKHENTATLHIFGDIVDDVYDDGVCALSFAYELEQLGEVDSIDVYINSYGGSVAQGFSIYNQLKNHPAKIRTICNGFACSIASVIFLAGDERIMQGASLLMIHNPFCMTMGNASELRKTADDLDKMAQVSIDLYCQATGLDESTIKDMMDKETWLSASDALELGFATNVENKNEMDEPLRIVQSVRTNLINKILNDQQVMTQEEPQEEVAPNSALNSFLKIFK